MKKFTVLLSVVFAASLAYAGDAKDATKEAAKDVKAGVKDAKSEVKAEVKETKADAKKLTHEVEAEVVSVDSVKGTITIKTEKGESTAPIEGKAIAEVKDVKPGQKVTLICRDDAKGEHKAVSEIKTKTMTEKK